MTTTTTPAVEKPTLTFDDTSEFCRRWVHRWKQKTSDVIEYERDADDGTSEAKPKPTIEYRRPAADGLVLTEAHGEETRGAAAALKMLCLAGERRIVWAAYDAVAPFRAVCDAVYGLVSRHQRGALLLDRVLIGNDQRSGAGTYVLTRSIFIRLIGLVYLIAFWSIGSQIDGLVGSRGISPAAGFLRAAKMRFGDDAYHYFPTLAWLNASDAMLHGLCNAGIVLAIAVVLGLAPKLCLALLWVAYLSIVTVGQQFLSFQWDALLLEAGFLAILFAPVNLLLSNKSAAPPSRTVHFLIKWLLFRLMFLSGVVKLRSGDPSWADWTAMGFHYESQPLPTWTSWFMHHLSMSLHKAETLGTFVVELVIPFLFFAPRRLRTIAFAVTALLQLSIAATGNYGFFNLLTFALCVALLDDAAWPAWLRDRRLAPPAERPTRPVWRRWALLPIAAVIVFVSTVQGVTRAHYHPAWTMYADPIVQEVADLRITSAYGLFEIMTKQRPEIVFEGSDDGVTWRPYTFRWKPDDDLARRPRFCTPHMPRLDWQLWFAAMTEANESPWTYGVAKRMLEGSPPVLDLFKDNPFPDKPPTYVRARVYQYHFTTREERALTGNWWTREPGATYIPPMTLEDFRQLEQR